MDKVIRKLYDYRVSIPTDMLKSLEINKGDKIELTKVDNGILLTKVRLNKSNNEEELPIKGIIKEVKTFSTVKVNKRKEIYLPKEMFNKYQLSGKSFSISKFESLSSEVTCLLILDSNNGRYKFRKDNAISLGYLFPELEVEQGQEVKVSIINNSINLNIKKKVEPVSFTTTTYSTTKEPQVISLNEQKEHFKVRIGKSGVITIPSVIFNKYELSKAKFNYVVTGNLYSGLRLELEVNKNGSKSFRKINVFSLNEIMSPHNPVEGQFIDLEVNDNNLVFNFSPEACIFNHCSNNKDSKLRKNNDEIMEKIYKNKLEKVKESDSVVSFINSSDLPKNEKDCYKCGTKLTSNDNSMISGHRVCNKCKMRCLNEIFSPIKKLAEIRERRKLNDKES